MSDQHNNIWPPPPSVPPPGVPPPNIQRPKRFEQNSLTKYQMLDFVLGIPSGFFAGLIWFFIAAAIVESIKPPPMSELLSWVEWALGLLLAALMFFLIGRRYLVLAIGMGFGGIVFGMFSFFVELVGQAAPP